MTREEIMRMTTDLGEPWARSHVLRVLNLIAVISNGINYDQEALWYAVWLHDWGAFPKFMRPEVDHAHRSRELAEENLGGIELSHDQKTMVLEAIEHHDYRDLTPVHSIEAVLLRDADCLDLLGMIGVARAFGENAGNIKAGRALLVRRMNTAPERLALPRSRELGNQRLSEMENFLRILDGESQECL